MSIIELVAIAVGLGMDAFAVCISTGCSIRRVRFMQIVRMAGAFGLFQGGMAIAGWLLGQAIAKLVAAVAPWIAFVLLFIVGTHMIVSGFKQEKEQAYTALDATQGWVLLGLAVATSIDAFAVGTSLSLLNHKIGLASAVIALVAAGMSVLGLKIGCRLGEMMGKRMEIVGGAILLLIAVMTILKL